VLPDPPAVLPVEVVVAVVSVIPVIPVGDVTVVGPSLLADPASPSPWPGLTRTQPLRSPTTTTAIRRLIRHPIPRAIPRV